MAKESTLLIAGWSEQATSGQDIAILIVEVPLLLLTPWWYRRGGPVAAVALTGVLAFFAYFYVSMTFATAENRLFPSTLLQGAWLGFALVAGTQDRSDQLQPPYLTIPDEVRWQPTCWRWPQL